MRWGGQASNNKCVIRQLSPHLSPRAAGLRPAGEPQEPLSHRGVRQQGYLPTKGLSFIAVCVGI